MATAQSPNWSWANAAGGTHDDEATAIGSDASGNVFATGYFTSDSITFGNITLRNPGFFLVKYDVGGNVMWAKQADGGGHATGLCVDDSGNVYVTGYFGRDTIRFDTVTLVRSGNPGWMNMFLVKYDTNGNAIWARSSGGTSYDYATACSIDPSGNILVTGTFIWSSVTFDSTVLTNAGGGDVFLVKYNSSGNVLWAQGFGAPQGEVPYGVATDNSGNVLLTGYFSDPSWTIGSTTLYSLSTSAYGEVFIIKTDNSGNVLWAKSGNGTRHEEGLSITTDGSSIYAAGFFYSDTIYFGSIFIVNPAPSQGTCHPFLVKYDANGNEQWARTAVGTTYDGATSVKADHSGNILLAGFFQSPAISFGTISMNNSGTFSEDMFVADYDANGNAIWAKSAGGNDNDFADAVDIDASGNILVAGYYKSDSISFGSTMFYNDTTDHSLDLLVAVLGAMPTIIQSDYQTVFSIFPNPSNGKFIIENKNNNPKMNLEIYNSLGEKIYSSTITKENSEIDLSGQPNGVYLIKLFSDSEIATEKIIIAH